ncbi:MAG TPA: HDOD domain-containing protein [Kofleriaceae bacterium]|jgi:HD-like signal output (HDOD) protein
MQVTKKRILFVDDEPAILAGLKSLLRKERDRWEMVFASGAEAALAELTKQPFDVVISDMRMPGMDGAALLARIKQESPSTVRVMMTGHAESEAILRALPSTHQLLSKPCFAGTLRAVLERCRGLDAGIGDASILAVVGGLDRLPSPPAMYVALTDIVADGRASPADVAAIIEDDPAVAAKVLQLANTSYFGEGRAICSIERAVSCLGNERIQYMVLATSSFTEVSCEPSGIDIDAIQRDGRESARAVRRLVTEREAGDIAFAAALLHDVGHIVLGLGMGAAYRRVLARAETTRQPLHVVERELLHLTHADVGACLLDLWGLPRSIVEAVRYHHDPDAAPAETRAIAAAVHAAAR